MRCGFWKKYYHVDGFHLLGDGVPGELIERDPFLYGVKKMFSDISGQPEKENMLAEYNRGFMQDMRRLLKSDEGMVAGHSSISSVTQAISGPSTIWQARTVLPCMIQ